MIAIQVPVVSISIWVPIPDLIQSCVVFSPSQVDPVTPSDPSPEVEQDVEIWMPIAPGIEYESLPSAPTVVDTSPDRMIGCIVGVGDNPQGRLQALFSDAISGDGVIDRTTNDIWTYDGTVWSNVGPTPGPTIVVETVIPPWNETVIAESLVRTRLDVQTFPYTLTLLTEINPITTRTELGASKIKRILSPSLGTSLQATPPSIVEQLKIFGKVVHVEYYTGRQPAATFLATPWPTSMAIIGNGPGWSLDKLWFDKIRGNNSAFYTRYSNGEISPAAGSVSFDSNGLTVNSNLTNSDLINYSAYIFNGTKDPVLNTAGSLPTLVHESEAFNIIQYTSNGVNDMTIGHGMSAPPDLMIFRAISASLSLGAVACGPVLGGPFWYSFLSSTSSRTSVTSIVRAYDNQRITIGTDSSVNSSTPVPYTCYAFKNTPGKCKIGVYSGNGLATGQFIDCGFPVGVLLVKARSATGDWVLMNRWQNPQGFAAASLNRSNDTIASSQFYSFEGKGFRVNNASSGNTGISFLNTIGVDYIYMAMASGFYRRLECPSADFDFQAITPMVSSGARLDVVTLQTNLKGLNPPYAGVRAAVVGVPTIGLSYVSTAPEVRCGVALQIDLVNFRLKSLNPGYAGQVTADVQDYAAVVASRDGQPLESTAIGSVYRFVKSLKDQGLWDKFSVICTTCVARTISGSLVPLKGTYAQIPNTSNFTYNRRTGILPINTSAVITLNMTPNDLQATNNHIAAYANTLNTFSGGDLIGDGFQANSMVIGRRTAVSGFETRNKNSSTNTSSSPHWTAPSLVGSTRSTSASYTIRVAKSNRTVSAGITDQLNTINTGSIRLFQFWNGTGNFRVPFYSMGQAIDLAALEATVEAFLTDLRLEGIPNTRVLPQAKNIQIQAVDPFLAGRFRILVKVPRVTQSISVGQINVNTGVAVATPSADIDHQGVPAIYIGQQPALAYVPSLEIGIQANSASVQTGAPVLVGSSGLQISAIAPVMIGDPLIKITGRIFSYYSYSNPTSGTGNDPNDTVAATYASRFGNILPYQPALPMWGYCDTNGCSLTRTEGIFNHFRIGWNMSIVGDNGCWMGDTSDFDLEFQTAAGSTIAAIRVICNEGNFRNGMYYGPNLSTLTKTGQTGSDPKTGGILTSTATQLIFTNTRVASATPGSGFNNSWTFNCNMTQVRRLRVTNISVDSNWTGGVCAAQVLLQINSYTPPA